MAVIAHELNGELTCAQAELEDGIGWAILNRPDKRNAMSPTLNDEMLRILDAFEVDDRVKVVVVTGAGDSFSAGMDLKEFFRDLWDTITRGKAWHGEVRNRAKDGTFNWMAQTIVPFLDTHGMPRQFVAIGADITDRPATPVIEDRNCLRLLFMCYVSNCF